MPQSSHDETIDETNQLQTKTKIDAVTEALNGRASSSSSSSSSQLPLSLDSSQSQNQQSPSYPPSTPHLNPHGLLILSHQSRGRGVYASRILAAGTVVEISPVLLFGKEEWEQYGCRTVLDSYTFKWGRMGDMALALGLGSLFNHSSSPSVMFKLDRSSHSIRYSLTRDVAAGEELCISYGAWGRQYDSDACDSDTDAEEVERRDLANLMKIGEDRSDSEEEVGQNGNTSAHRASHSRRGTKKTRTRYPNGSTGMVATSHSSGSESGRDPSKQQQAQQRSTSRNEGVATAGSDDSFRRSNDGSSGRSSDEPVSAEVARSSEPIWRLTSLPDPATVPLTTIPCYAILIPPRSSSGIMSLLREHSLLLGRGKSPGCEDDPIRHAKTLMRNNSDEGKLRALVCVRDRVKIQDLKRVLNSSGLLEDEAEEGRNILEVQVASNAAPTKARAAEWSVPWPVALRSTAQPSLAASASASPNQSSSPSPNGTLLGNSHAAGPPSSALSLGSKPSFVDRKADGHFWSLARTRWVVQKLARCVLLAEEARENGEVPVGVHVCPSILPVNVANQEDEGNTSSSSLQPASSHEVGAHAGVLFGGWDSDGIPLEGGEAIEVDAHDTRVSRRNPIKHAVGNAVQKVAEIRAYKRGAVGGNVPAANGSSAAIGVNGSREATVAINGTSAAISQGNGGERGRSAPDDGSPELAWPTPRSALPPSLASHSVTPPSSSPHRPSSPLPLLNGQDYLLTSLTLFSTHEPCVYCCMSLVHSRVRTLIFLETARGAGGCCGSELPRDKRCDVGLHTGSASGQGTGSEAEAHGETSIVGGPYALQEQKGLNHRFEVWKWRGGWDEVASEVERQRAASRRARRRARESSDRRGTEEEEEDGSAGGNTQADDDQIVGDATSLQRLLDLQRLNVVDP